jgi:hypothetical protein
MRRVQAQLGLGREEHERRFAEAQEVRRVRHRDRCGGAEKVTWGTRRIIRTVRPEKGNSAFISGLDV